MFVSLIFLFLFFSLFSFQVVTSSPNCSNFTTCSACSTDEYCGWCEYSNECMPGSFEEPNKGFYCYTNDNFFWDYMECPYNKCQYNGNTCLSCITLQDPDCGWCESEHLCLPGRTFGPTRGYKCNHKAENQTEWFYDSCVDGKK